MKRQIKKKFTVYDIARIGMMIATLEVVKRLLDSIPNIEMVSFFIIMFTVFYGWKTLAAVFAFVFLECAFWGFGIWVISYFYVWPILVFLIMIFRKHDHIMIYCIISAAFGFCFGALCTFPIIIISGPKAALGWWIAGLTFDIVHCIGNFTVCLILYKPVRLVMEKATGRK